MPRCRDVYLKIERMPGYSPLASDDAERNLFRRDCMFNHGHEDGKIPDSEVALSRLDAIVYREYLDPGYTTPNMAPLITADVNEPGSPWLRMRIAVPVGASRRYDKYATASGSTSCRFR